MDESCVKQGGTLAAMSVRAGSANQGSRPAMLNGTSREFNDHDLLYILEHFQLDSIESVAPFSERGNINQHTYEVIADEGQRYLLQRLNSDIFCMPHRLMDSMCLWLEGQRQAIDSGEIRPDSVWEPITLIQTRVGGWYFDLSDEGGLSVWRLMVKIDNTFTYKSLSGAKDRQSQLVLAEEVGRGLAINASLTRAMNPEGLLPSLPGYRDTAGYMRQFRSVIAGNKSVHDAEGWIPKDPEVRIATEHLYYLAGDDSQFQQRIHDPLIQPYVDLCRNDEPFALSLSAAVESGDIAKTVIHGDTKLDNFLFCRSTGKVRSLIDLDTIMSYTWLADWGDMVRSLCNVAGEKERDLSKVQVDLDVFLAICKGFLEVAENITDAEKEWLVDAPAVIALELGVRFLTDYLRGDNYFRIDSGVGDEEDINRVRALVQLDLYCKLRGLREELLTAVLSMA